MPPDKTIVVNTKEHPWDEKEISYSDVVHLAHPDADFAQQHITYTVTYRRGMGNKPEGTLVDGKSVKVKDGMIFDVTRTDRS